jgi:hypothetical protein
MFELNDDIKNMRDLLNRNSSILIEELKRIADFKNHPETELLEFEIHDLDSFVLYPMTKEGEQVFEENQNNFFAGSYTVKLRIRPILNDYFSRLNKNFDKSLYNEMIKITIEWFSDYWDKVKNKVDLPTYISLHDSHTLFDLSNKRWGKMYEQYS